eukprot:16261317-Heterocapsa_arctica.AAC.1
MACSIVEETKSYTAPAAPIPLYKGTTFTPTPTPISNRFDVFDVNDDNDDDDYGDDDNHNDDDDDDIDIDIYTSDGTIINRDIANTVYTSDGKINNQNNRRSDHNQDNHDIRDYDNINQQMNVNVKRKIVNKRIERDTDYIHHNDTSGHDNLKTIGAMSTRNVHGDLKTIGAMCTRDVDHDRRHYNEDDFETKLDHLCKKNVNNNHNYLETDYLEPDIGFQISRESFKKVKMPLVRRWAQYTGSLNSLDVEEEEPVLVISNKPANGARNLSK